MGKARSQTLGTRQKTDFCLSTWNCPQVVLEGCRVNWSLAVTEWSSFSVARH